MPADVLFSLLLAQAGVSLYLVGLIWFVQVVHYPLHSWVGASEFAAYEIEHRRRTVWVTAAPMLLELGLAWFLVIQPTPLPAWQTWTGALLASWVWLQTLLIHLPQHARLCRGRDAATLRSLVRLNLIRTACWTVRGFLSLAMLAECWRNSLPM